jgi:hypothetical protein
MPFTNLTNAVERISGVSPSPFGFGVENGRAQMLLKIPADYLLPAMREALGYTTVSGIGLERSLPLAHPMFPWLFCERISNGQGVQFKDKRSSTGEENGVTVDLEADPFPYYARYESYELALEFLPRPYAVVTDQQLQRKTIQWWDIDTPAANPLSFDVQTEWWRYLELDQQPAGDYITAAQGAFLFRMDSNPTGFTLQNVGIPTGQLKLYISAKAVKFRWYQVPFAWVISANSYFDKYTGRVNQYEFYNYPKGTLLLNSVEVMRVYTQPFPEFVPYNGAFLPSQQKLCDLQFNCVYRNPTLAKAYTPGGSESKNNIIGGHNLIPCHVDNKFYYGTNENNNLAIYPSVPFEIFFRNPDA